MVKFIYENNKNCFRKEMIKIKDLYKWLVVAVVVIGLIVLALSTVHKAGATYNSHLYYVDQGFGDWSECSYSKDQGTQECGGTVEGTQTRTRTSVCEHLPQYPYTSNCSEKGDVIVTDTQTQGCEIQLPDCEPSVTPAPCTENCGNPPTFQGSTTEAPVCPDGNVTSVVANPHVIRNGTHATVNFFITEGDSANIYYKVSGQSNWQNSVLDVKPNGDNFVSYTINDLKAGVDYDFGIQQKVGCGGGQIVTSVVHDGFQKATFGFSYFLW